MEKDNLNNKSGYKKIGPTAQGVARFRAQADIKYAREIFNELAILVKPTHPLEVEYIKRSKKSNIAPQLEARYKLINRLLAVNKTNQVLEMASGLSPRGLTLTEKNPSLCYVEVELPEMAENKKQLLKALFDKNIVKPQKNLHVEDGDALDRNSLIEATRYFTDEPIAVINEGLLRYMNFDQKTIVAQNVYALLEKFGGVWITSDITLPRVLEHREQSKLNRGLIKALSGIDVEKNAFENEEAAIKFFEDLGFTIERHSFLEVIDDLVSPKKLSMPKEETKELIEHAVVFVMRLKEYEMSNLVR